MLNAQPLGITGNGGTVSLVANGALQVNQGVNASGVGSGNGGTINLYYEDATNPITIGASSANSFVNGNVTANAVGAGGVGGRVNIANSLTAPVDVNLVGTISSNATTAANLGKY